MMTKKEKRIRELQLELLRRIEGSDGLYGYLWDFIAAVRDDEELLIQAVSILDNARDSLESLEGRKHENLR